MRCPDCGYDLRGSDATAFTVRCPECGQESSVVNASFADEPFSTRDWVLSVLVSPIIPVVVAVPLGPALAKSVATHRLWDGLGTCAFVIVVQTAWIAFGLRRRGEPLSFRQVGLSLGGWLCADVAIGLASGVCCVASAPTHFFAPDNRSH
jgi:hypothetical protein